MKKILYISCRYYPPYYSGKLILAETRLRDLNSNQFEVIVFTSGVKNGSKFEKDGNITIYRSPFIGSGKISKRLNVLIFEFWSLLKLLKFKNISVIHFDDVGGISFPFFRHLGSKITWGHFTLLAKIARTRKISTIFENAGSDVDDPASWKRRFFNQIDHIVCESDALFESTSQLYPDKAKEIVCGIEEDLFVPLPIEEKANIRKVYGFSNQDLIFCFAGLIVHRKGFDLISEVFPQINKEFPESALWVIGPKSHKESRHIHDDEVERYQRMLDPVKDRVKYFGYIYYGQEFASLMGATDIFLFPTRQEGFGLVPVEAMACGVPPIIARLPGVTDLASIHGETGLYISPNNPEELKQAMRLLIQNKLMRKKMGEAARIRIEKEFSWAGHVAKWERLYDGQWSNEQ